MVELLYALDASGKMVSVDDVPNGIACNCTCPCCREPLVAKNNGESVSSHFAHASGASCGGAHESELHMLAKEIISGERRIMLPPYGNIYQGGMVAFDCVEVEKRNDIACLQPDLCGVVSSNRLWIEIMVTHAIGPEKRALIVKEGIACVEVNLSRFMNNSVTKDELRRFLLHDKDSREWTNNPKLEMRRHAVAEAKRTYAVSRSEDVFRTMDVENAKEMIADAQAEFLEENRDCCLVPYRDCFKCRHHSTRIALYDEVKRLHLPAWVKDSLSGNLLYYTRSDIADTVFYDRCYVVKFDQYLRILPTQSPDIHGRVVAQRDIRQNENVITFLLDTVPAIIASEGLKCRHCRHIVNVSPSRREVACNMPNVVNRHRRRR